jgi:hypothetical protein
MDQMDVTDIYRVFHTAAAQNIPFSEAYELSSK